VHSGRNGQGSSSLSGYNFSSVSACTLSLFQSSRQKQQQQEQKNKFILILHSKVFFKPLFAYIFKAITSLSGIVSVCT